MCTLTIVDSVKRIQQLLSYSPIIRHYIYLWIYSLPGVDEAGLWIHSFHPSLISPPQQWIVVILCAITSRASELRFLSYNCDMLWFSSASIEAWLQFWSDANVILSGFSYIHWGILDCFCCVFWDIYALLCLTLCSFISIILKLNLSGSFSASSLGYTSCSF